MAKIGKKSKFIKTFDRKFAKIGLKMVKKW